MAQKREPPPLLGRRQYCTLPAVEEVILELSVWMDTSPSLEHCSGAANTTWWKSTYNYSYTQPDQTNLQLQQTASHGRVNYILRSRRRNPVRAGGDVIKARDRIIIYSWTEPPTRTTNATSIMYMHPHSFYMFADFISPHIKRTNLEESWSSVRVREKSVHGPS